MAHSNRDKQSEERKQHKVAVKAERAEKIKKKTVWELMADEKAGIIQPKDGEEGTPQKKTRLRVRKVKAENRISHRRGIGKLSNKVCVQNPDGSVVYVYRSHAADLVKKGSSYTNKTTWRKWRDANEVDHEST